MKPLNSKERTIGLLKFIGIFLFTILLIIVAIFFDFSTVPNKELDYYKSRCKTLQDSIAADIQLFSQLNELNNNLEQYQNNPNNIVAQTSVGAGINSLLETAKKDSLSYTGKLSGQIATGYSIAANAVVKLKQSGDAVGDNSKLNLDLTKCQAESDKKDQQIKELQDKISKCRKW